MFIYRVTNYYTGEVYEYQCESQAVACRSAYRRAMSVLREMMQDPKIIPENCVLRSLRKRQMQYVARKYLRFGRVDPESRMMIYSLPLV